MKEWKNPVVNRLGVDQTKEESVIADKHYCHKIEHDHGANDENGGHPTNPCETHNNTCCCASLTGPTDPDVPTS